MNHKAHVQLETHTVEDTQQFGQLLGRWAKQSGEPLCIALIGDLGTGKTHLSQGIAKGFGVTEEITSPTFAIMNTYDVDRTHLYHFDVYRLSEAEEIYEVGYEDYLNSGGIILIERADIIKSELPKEYIEIKLFYHEDETREVELRYVGNPAKEKEMLKYVDFSN